jgi:L-alanine-DL-glutamate epimerase-like enolase superfamily enzyme
MKVQDGFAYPPDAPGLGIDWDWQAVQKQQSIHREIKA